MPEMQRVLIGLLFCFVPLLSHAAEALDIYFIDVEGGQATLIVTPSGQSLLVDTGWPGNNGRDADRIVAAANLAGVRRIDYLLVTHYHGDHVGGVRQLADRIPIAHFLDHGANTDPRKELFEPYTRLREKAPHTVLGLGDPIPLRGLEVKVLASDGITLSAAGGPPNPLCRNASPKEDDRTENGRSVGFLLTFGKFRFLDLGDLTWNRELALVCPSNAIGTVDVYLVTHHGSASSGPAALVHALRPRAAVLNNGARKGGSPEAWQIVRNSPRLEDLWQLHFATQAGPENNAPERFIANPLEECEGRWIKLSARRDGSFKVTNSRNGFGKAYGPAGN